MQFFTTNNRVGKLERTQQAGFFGQKKISFPQDERKKTRIELDFQ